jgi:hypothetical protein
MSRAKTEYSDLRASLINRGTNLRQWAAQNNYALTTVYAAARGSRNGIKSVQIKRKLEAFIYGKHSR